MAVTDARTAQVESGLDQLDLPAIGTTPWPRRLARVTIPKLVAFGVLLGVWQLVYALKLQSSFIIPSPGDVWAALVLQWQKGNVTTAVSTSILHGGEGYALAVLIGTPLGLLVARVQVVRIAIGSLIAALQSLPSVTWAPVGILWFGLSQTTILFVVVMGALPSIAGGMVAAVDQ